MAQLVSSILKDPQVEAARIPPQSIEAEQSVLGGLLLDNTAWDRVGDVITPQDFYRADHRAIFQHIGELIDHGKPADALTVAESLERSGKLAEIGGPVYLGSLAANTPSAANIRRYAEIVRERAIMRSLAAVGTEIADAAFSPVGKSAAQMLDEAEGRVFEIAEACARGRQGFVSSPVGNGMRRRLSLGPSAINLTLWSSMERGRSTTIHAQLNALLRSHSISSSGICLPILSIPVRRLTAETS